MTTHTTTPAPWAAAGRIPGHLERYAGPLGLLLAVVDQARRDARRDPDAARWLDGLRRAVR